MKISIAFCAVIGIGCLLMEACDAGCWNRTGGKEYKALTKIDEPGNSQMVHKFADYPVEKQIDIYLYAQDCPHDPRFESILARSGEKMIPAIVRRIELEPRIWDKYFLVNVLYRINAECKCIKSDSEVVKTLESVEQALDENQNISHDDAYKKMYKDAVDSLKSQIVER